jgi:hypothetical protein
VEVEVDHRKEEEVEQVDFVLLFQVEEQLH